MHVFVVGNFIIFVIVEAFLEYLMLYGQYMDVLL